MTLEIQRIRIMSTCNSSCANLHPNMIRWLTCLSVACAVAPVASSSEGVRFDPKMVQFGLGIQQEVDLSYLEKGFDVPPGRYTVDVEVNRKFAETASFQFMEVNGRLQPQLTVGNLRAFGINVDAIETLKDKTDDFPVDNIKSLIADADVKFNAGLSKLEISIPQLYMREASRDSDVASPRLWQTGDTALLVGYNMTASQYRQRHRGGKTQNFYFGYNSQFNLGAWRLYSSGSYFVNNNDYGDQSQTTDRFDVWNTYAQRDINAWRSRIRIGEISTNGEIFDSFSMRGVTLENNLEMLPYADRSYMPVVQGVAYSFATVSIRQNGRIVYQTNVAPGPWKLENLPTFANEGDLEVVTTEADGSQRIDIVPYSSVPMMIRQNQWRYSVSLGRYGYTAGHSDVKEPWFGQATLKYGLPFDMTAYGGMLLSGNYKAGALGLALSLKQFGAFSADVTHMWSEEDSSRGLPEKSGSAYRFRYSKTMVGSGTTVNLVNYRYLTGDYLSFSDYNNRGYAKDYAYDRLIGYEKGRWQFSISQDLGRWGNLSLSGMHTSYRNGLSSTRNWQLSYGTSIKGVGVYLNYSRNYERYGEQWRPTSAFMLNLDIPLSLFAPDKDYVSDTSVAYQVTRTNRPDGTHGYENQVTARGTIKDTKFNWQLSQTMGNDGDRSTAAMVGYNGDQIGGTASYTHSRSSESFQLAASGTLVAHRDGITPSQHAYGSVAIVEVEGVPDAKINRNANVTTNEAGFAVVTNLRNYAANEIVVDPSTLPYGALLLDGSNRTIYPTAGSVISVKFPVRLGRQALMTLYTNKKEPLPFGTKVNLLKEDGTQDESVSALVGDKGVVYLSGIPAEGKIQASWIEKGSSEQAVFAYKLGRKEQPDENGFVPIEHLTLFPVINFIEKSPREKICEEKFVTNLLFSRKGNSLRETYSIEICE